MLREDCLKKEPSNVSVAAPESLLCSQWFSIPLFCSIFFIQFIATEIVLYTYFFTGILSSKTLYSHCLEEGLAQFV